jgi:hypothetical protein
MYYWRENIGGKKISIEILSGRVGSRDFGRLPVHKKANGLDGKDIRCS